MPDTASQTISAAEAHRQQQSAWIALATDGPLRARFVEDPAAALAAWRPGADPLTALDPIALERYAQSLIAKRAHELRRAIPMALRLAPDLIGWYRAWLWDHPAPPGDVILAPGVAEGIRALPHLRDRLQALIDVDGPVAPYAPDVLAFELYRRASVEDGEIRTLRCRHRADEIIRAMRRGTPLFDPAAEAVRFRFTRGGVQWRR